MKITRGVLLLVLFSSLVSAGFVSAAQGIDKIPLDEASLQLPGIENAVTQVADIVGKSVVSISTERTAKIKTGKRRIYFNGPFGGSPDQGDDPFSRFFDDFMGGLPDREFKQMGLGSGVIIDEKGNILTNEHVVNGADKVTVTLSDGREFKAEIKGRDPRSDLAIIKINAGNLPVAKLGDSDNIKIGQWVVAIGNPFAFALQNPEPTVTVGVVSALHRSLGRAFTRERDYGNLIQTDAAINPGNSGGPLVNLKGEVIGINTAIFSTSGGYQGVGFAIPINSAKRILSKLVEGKKISYGWLGVTVQDLNEDLAKYFNLPDKNGALIAKVLEDGPAAKSGLKDGDIIKQFDNKPINSVKDLLAIVSATEAGKKVKVVVIRDKKQVSVDLGVGERPQDLDVAQEEIVSDKEESGVWRGLKVSDLSADLKKRIRTEENQGVVVTDIEQDSPAEGSGLIVGDVITSINKQAVKNIADYQKITKGLKGMALVRTSRGYFLVKESAK